LDGKWVLIISPHRPCEYFVGNLDINKVKFTPETHGIIDAGAAYASNISRDDEGRTLLWFGRPKSPPRARGGKGVRSSPCPLPTGAAGFLPERARPASAPWWSKPKSW